MAYLHLLAVDNSMPREDYTRHKLIAEDMDKEDNLVAGLYEWVRWIAEHPGCRIKAFIE